MQQASRVIAGVGLADRSRKSRWPARLDLAQSASGLALGLFMWGHMLFVASILVSEDLMWAVSRLFEGYFLFGSAHPGIVSAIVAGVIAMLVLHASLAMRKFPADYRQYRTFVDHKNLLRHEDTTLWWVQCATGFALFFLATVHLYQMLMHPGDIGPYESADRVWTGRWWPIYLVMLFCVELHAGIGLYRLAVKWCWFEGSNSDASRRRLRAAKWAMTAFFLVLGLASLAAYMKLGYEHRAAAGARYTPSWLRTPPQGEPPFWWPSGLKAPPG